MKLKDLYVAENRSGDYWDKESGWVVDLFKADLFTEGDRKEWNCIIEGTSWRLMSLEDIINGFEC